MERVARHSSIVKIAIAPKNNSNHGIKKGTFCQGIFNKKIRMHLDFFDQFLFLADFYDIAFWYDAAYNRLWIYYAVSTDYCSRVANRSTTYFRKITHE